MTVIYSFFGNIAAIILLIGLITNEFLNSFLNKTFNILGNIYPQASIFNIFDLPSKLPSEHKIINIDRKCAYFYDIFGQSSQPKLAIIDRRVQTYSFICTFFVNYFSQIYNGESKLYTVFGIIFIYIILLRLHMSTYKCISTFGQLLLTATIGILYALFYYKNTMPNINNNKSNKNEIFVADKNLKCKLTS